MAFLITVIRRHVLHSLYCIYTERYSMRRICTSKVIE